ncbi:hypothetical protein P9578_01505 [Brevibacillus choshinensis]|uniref:hypothetical protein n=1 Tax=Brevibacillus choshinensis TaxID=54911 RepID=UPI002E1ECBA9|nr:hypothetical protein [Brevibacillus choshinensis]MED4783239.1 hypothetical protein [Brevibacillus choshinensis]
MTKRLKKSEFMMAYMIIISLACAVGGFFFGAHYMKAQMESERTAALEAEQKEAAKDKLLKEQKLYNEQDFIRFHYAVYAPLLQFRQAHFDVLAKWTTMDKQAQSDSLKQLTKQAEQTLKALEKNVPLPTSPMLVQAHSNFTNSVRAYLDSMEQIRSDQNSNALTPAAITARLTLFQNSWLTAQEMMYHSVAAWESAYVVKQPLPKTLPQTVSTGQWKQYPFHYRTYLAAAAMSADKQWKSYNPEDVTARIDKLVATNEAQSLGIQDVTSAVRLLNATDAIHPGDFKQMSGRLYSQLQAPEIPLYK